MEDEFRKLSLDRSSFLRFITVEKKTFLNEKYSTKTKRNK